ncbi:MAG: hypothetical protein H6745_01240 [Deltaproteobacteria bacterium]|nr:hypothetical protein [Deltaproteobacteria bacterium]
MKYVLALAAASLLAFAACSDDGSTNPATDTASPTDTTAPDTTEADTEGGDATSPEDTTATCEHPCLNAFGKNDKSLCPSPQSDWNCVEGCCELKFRCADDDDCRALGYDEGQCTDERFDCRCTVTTGVCYAFYCAADADCESGEICAAGSCQVPPAATGLTPRILNRPTALTTGATMTLATDLVDPTNADVAVAATGLTFTSDHDDVAAVSAEGVVTGGSAQGTATITAATAGGQTATWTVRNVLPATDGFTAVIADEVTAEAAAGKYAILDHTGGAVLVEDVIPTDGVIRYENPTAAALDLHVYATDHDWISWLGADAHATLYLPLARTLNSKVELDMAGDVVAEGTTLEGAGIVRGMPDMTDYLREGSLEIGLTSFALSSALFDFNLKVLLGSDVKRFLDPNHHIPQVDGSSPLTVPGGIVFNLAGPAVPSFVLTAGEGHHRMWTLSGRLDITEIGEYSATIVNAVTGGDLDFTQIVGAVFPLFRNFWSGFVADVDVTATGPGSAETTVDPKLRMPLGLEQSLDVPPLPELGGLGYADALFILGGALTVDGFLVPLGLNGGADTSNKEQNPPDGIADANEHTPEKDPFMLPLAPLYGGLQGPHSSYLTALVAVAIKGSGDPRPDSGSGILVRSEPGHGPAAAPTLPAFLGFPLTSAWSSETRVATVGAQAGADVQRVLFKGKTGRHWTIWLNGATSVTVPTPPEGVDDRATTNIESVLVNCLDLADGEDMAAIAAPGGTTLDNLLGHVSRISFVDVKSPIVLPEQ